jgi:O-antigen ligase
VALAAALPFELVRPVAPLGPFQLSSVEVFLYATVGLWAAWRLALLVEGAGARSRSPLVWWRALPEAQRAAAVWSLVLLLSAALAPLARGAAVKFALRSLGGVTLFVAAADLLDSRRALWRTMVGLTIGAAVAAALMALEMNGGTFSTWLRPFHGQTFWALGLTRASGPFQYPNIAAMYLEGALPVIVAAGVMAMTRLDPDQARRVLVGTALVSMLIIVALVLAASRAGLITELVVLIGIGALARELPVLRRLSFGLAAGLLIVTVVAQAVSPLLALRLRFWQTKAWYAEAIEPAPDAEPLPAKMAPGAEAQVELFIRNTGKMTWPAGGKKPVKLSYHWLTDDGSLVNLEGRRTDLPHDVPSDGTVTVTASVRMPERPGRYVLWWDLVHEQVTWFGGVGNLGLNQRVAVGTTASKRKGWDHARTAVDQSVFDEFSRQQLWLAGFLAFLDHPLLGIGPDNFRRAYGGYLGRAQTDERLHANNFYVEVLATLGLAGLGALVLMVVALARTARRAAAHTANRVLVLGLGAALVAYLVHGTLDYFLEFTPTYALLWLLAGALVALERLAKAQDRAVAGARLVSWGGAAP